MEDIESYKTLAGEGFAEIIEKKSKFLGRAFPLDKEEGAAAALAAAAKTHHAASHHVYAYVLGTDGETLRQSDAGEPSGTAGTPALAALRSQGLTFAMVIVTRYFGGTLLGAGGLARAYGQAAREAVAAAGIITKNLCDDYAVKAPYTLLGKLQYEYGKKGYTILATDYAEAVTLTVRIPANDAAFAALTAELSAGTATAAFVGRGYV